VRAHSAGGHDHDYSACQVRPSGVAVVKSGTDFRELSRLALRLGPAGAAAAELPAPAEAALECSRARGGRRLDVRCDRVEVTSAAEEDAEVLAIVQVGAAGWGGVLLSRGGCLGAAPLETQACVQMRGRPPGAPTPDLRQPASGLAGAEQAAAGPSFVPCPIQRERRLHPALPPAPCTQAAARQLPGAGSHLERPPALPPTRRSQRYASVLGDSLGDTVGRTLVDLDGRFEAVRSRETALGNFVCDVWRASCARARVQVVLCNSGTLRSDAVHAAGDLTNRDLMAMLPMLDATVVLDAPGGALLEALENGVSLYPRLEGRFLQARGLGGKRRGRGGQAAARQSARGGRCRRAAAQGCSQAALDRPHAGVWHQLYVRPKPAPRPARRARQRASRRCPPGRGSHVSRALAARCAAAPWDTGAAAPPLP
jgi:hypothetical protein